MHVFIKIIHITLNLTYKGFFLIVYSIFMYDITFYIFNFFINEAPNEAPRGLWLTADSQIASTCITAS